MAQNRPAYDAKLESTLRAAAVIFAEKGYHQASIRDIARTTGTSLAGLYYYFQSKEELLFLIADHALGILLGTLESALASTSDPVEKLRLLIDNHLRFFVHNMAEMKVLAYESNSLTGEFRANVNAQKRHLTLTATQILREVDPGSDLDDRVSTFALFGMMNWLYAWYRPDRDVDVDKLIQDMTRIFMQGFLGSEAQAQHVRTVAAPEAPTPAPARR